MMVGMTYRTSPFDIAPFAVRNRGNKNFCTNNSTGRVSPFQGEGCGFESRLVLCCRKVFSFTQIEC